MQCGRVCFGDFGNLAIFAKKPLFQRGADISERHKQAAVQPEADAVNASAEIKVRAERRMGEELAKAELSKGAMGNPGGRGASIVRSVGTTAHSALTLAEIGISKDQSSRYQQLAAIAEWVRLTDSHAAQVAPHCKPGQKPGGINAAVRELGIDRSEAQRACKIAAMPDGRF